MSPEEPENADAEGLKVALENSITKLELMVLNTNLEYVRMVLQ